MIVPHVKKKFRALVKKELKLPRKKQNNRTTGRRSSAEGQKKKESGTIYEVA